MAIDSARIEAARKRLREKIVVDVIEQHLGDVIDEVNLVLTALGEAQADTTRLDYMEANLKRTGAEMHFADGDRIRPRHAWAIASELNTLRETIDALIAHGPSAFARRDS